MLITKLRLATDHTRPKKRQKVVQSCNTKTRSVLNSCNTCSDKMTAWVRAFTICLHSFLHMHGFLPCNNFSIKWISSEARKHFIHSEDTVPDSRAQTKAHVEYKTTGVPIDCLVFLQYNRDYTKIPDTQAWFVLSTLKMNDKVIPCLYIIVNCISIQFYAD